MRSHYCGELNSTHIDQEIELCGWVHRRRDHGGVIFIDLRDREGIAQIVFDPDRAESFAIADSVRNEFVIKITGKVRHRPEGTINPEMPTGEIEVLGYSIEILNKAKTPPIQMDDEHVHDDIKLKYRYVDLRRTFMQRNLRLRSKIAKEMRDFLDARSFLDIETPMLTKATPEGARDYLVPSRTHPGNFFALPQSPQLFKQLLMMSGMDRYYQIVRCFRDEDLRADRQPEFTQLDIEMSFMNEDEITGMMEEMLITLFKNVLDIELPSPFPRMTYAEAMERFGSDRPDLRNPLELIDVSDLMKEVEFKVFSGPANMENGRVATLHVPGGSALSQPEQMRERIFEPNFTTKSSGMGLGLAMVRGMIENANGNIVFDTVEGQGTTFTVKLPELKKENGQCSQQVKVRRLLRQVMTGARIRHKTARNSVTVT